MSLKRFVQRANVCERLKVLRPVDSRLAGLPIKVAPRSSNPQLLGTAFDYLLRFELGRRVRGAESTSWAAEYAVHGAPGINRAYLEKFPSIKAILAHQRKRERSIKRVVNEARKGVAQYQRKRKPKLSDHIALAAHALRLAKLDEVYRSHTLIPDFAEAAESEVAELVDLLAVVPFEDFTDCKRLILNPEFGDASELVGGADADLIIDDLLIDVKTTKDARIKSDHLDQLMGYFILARRARETDPTFPEIRRLGFYYSRFAYFWIWDVSALATTVDFLTAEVWFIEEAEKSSRPPAAMRAKEIER